MIEDEILVMNFILNGLPPFSYSCICVFPHRSCSLLLQVFADSTALASILLAFWNYWLYARVFVSYVTHILAIQSFLFDDNVAVTRMQLVLYEIYAKHNWIGWLKQTRSRKKFSFSHTNTHKVVSPIKFSLKSIFDMWTRCAPSYWTLCHADLSNVCYRRGCNVSQLNVASRSEVLIVRVNRSSAIRQYFHNSTFPD